MQEKSNAPENMASNGENRLSLAGGKKWSALIVDDEPDVREILCDYVKQIHPQVTLQTAADGADGLRRAENQAFDLVITDLQMPKLGGNAFVQSLSQLNPPFRPKEIFVVSAHFDPAHTPPFFSEITFFSKPVMKASFQAQVARVFKENSKIAQAKRASPEGSASEEGRMTLINSFLTSALKTMDDWTQSEFQRKQVGLRQSADVTGDYTWLVDLKTDQGRASFGVGFPAATLEVILSVKKLKGSGKTLADIFPGVVQAFHLETLSKMKAGGCEPQVVQTKSFIRPNHRIEHTLPGSCLVVRFASTAGELTIEAVSQVTPAS